ncbi:ELKS/Rab6-interacting/CAST family member 1-like [Cydia amplana]|uniref:ELKS/Rab6-interacting/CAST family member 1-like n=1 Tax=Cydia amplana TaxID=1869771 RepID=UPI002FE696F0
MQSPKLETPAPVSRSGAGDISERELSRERSTMQTTPPARHQRALHKNKLFSVPVNKFTTRCQRQSPNLARIRSCLEELRSTPARPVKIGPKAVSMEDLTPTKRIKRESTSKEISKYPLGGAEEQAAARIGRFMLACAWRRRRDEVRCLRKTLEFQISCSERLRIQVHALKSLLDSDNGKVRLAMRELERLKQLLRDKEAEKSVLEKEKNALERDLSNAEDRASEMSIGWRNCRNEVEGVRAAAAVSEHALSLERAASAEARSQRDRAYTRLSHLEADLSQYEALLAAAEAEAAALRREADEKQALLQLTSEQLKLEKDGRERCARDCSALAARVALAADETSELRGVVSELRAELARLDAELRVTREQLAWWPRPLTRMMGAARSLLRYPLSVPEAIVWALVPARHGC